MSKPERNRDTGMPWHVWGCMAIAFLIPFAKKFVPGFIGLLSIYVIVYAIRRKRIHRPLKILPLAFLLAIFILHVTGLIWSEHVTEGIQEIGIKFSYAIFPLMAWLMPPFSQKQIRNIAQAFACGCISFIPLAIGYGIYRSISHNDITYLVYQNLGIYLHPTYAAAYQALALLIIVRSYVRGESVIRNKFLFYAISVIILLFICMLESKAGLIAALIAVGMGCYLLNKHMRSSTQVVLTGFAALFIMSAATYLLPGSSSRVEAAISDIDHEVTTETPNESQHTEAKSSTELRLAAWKTSVNLILQNPIGTGTGDAQFEINKNYEATGEHYAAQKELNAHNQFLQAGVEHGWAGIILLISCLITVAVWTVNSRDVMMMAFVAISTMNFLFESFLEVQAGIVFFCFWIMVFSKSLK